MIVLAKITLCITWLIAFLLTCLLAGICYPLITIAEKLELFFDGR
ncbi:hypothetical protein [Dyadobacter sandarakinus]|nr:hypothetical protein [Dyadobacter sandarakinus]